MAGCRNHVELGVCDPNCPERFYCHDFRGWKLPDGRPVIYHTFIRVEKLVDGGVDDPNVDSAIVVAGDESFGKYIETIPIETLRRSVV